VTIHRVLDADTLRGAVREAIAAAKAHGATRFLIDMRTADLELTTLQIYSSGDVFELAGLKSVRRAIVASRISADLAFHQEMAARRGQVVCIFTDVAEARSWLADAPPPVDTGTSAPTL
jgi:hypothetical protein